MQELVVITPINNNWVLIGPILDPSPNQIHFLEIASIDFANYVYDNRQGVWNDFLTEAETSYKSYILF